MSWLKEKPREQIIDPLRDDDPLSRIVIRTALLDLRKGSCWCHANQVPDGKTGEHTNACWSAQGAMVALGESYPLRFYRDEGGLLYREEENREGN